MHELGIVFHVIRTVENAAAENALAHVDAVTLELGEVSGVVHAELTSCWKWAVIKTTLLEGAELLIETIPAVTWCESCQSSYPTVPQGKICPHCGSADTWLLQGNEMNIKEIRVY